MFTIRSIGTSHSAARVLLEQHVEETENSLGRKASDVGRKLAADLGLRSRKPGPGGRNPRELGPGGG